LTALGVWYEFDLATQYNPNFMPIFFGSGGAGVQDQYRSTGLSGSYPAAFKQKFVSHRNDWQRMADVQTSTIGNFLGSDWSDIQAAFEDFGQGTLLNADQQRRDDNNSIHMMDGQDDNPPVGYHRWHASIRVMQLLNIGDATWWENLDRVVGLAWGIQSFAKPRQQSVPNPSIAKADLQALRAAWLPLTPDRRDRQYDATTDASGYHPSPKLPVA
jgi:hypothetical protein